MREASVERPRGGHRQGYGVRHYGHWAEDELATTFEALVAAREDR